MDNELILLAARACLNSYTNNIDLGSTEYSLTLEEYKGDSLQVLSVPGTNEMADWLWNLHMWSTDGIKRCSYLAAKKVMEDVKHKIDPKVKLMVTGHSKDAPTALRYKEQYGADYCVAFCPARAFRRGKRLPLTNTTTVIDPDDFVPVVGILSFGHRSVEKTVKLPHDKAWYDVKGRIEDHDMAHIMHYFEEQIKGR